MFTRRLTHSFHNMTPEEKKLLLQTAKTVQELSAKFDSFLNIYYQTNFPTRMVINKNLDLRGIVTFGEGINIVLGSTTGTKFGTSSTQKIAFLGNTPISQQAAITKPTAPGATYSEAEADSMKVAVDLLIDYFKAFGFTA